MTRRKIALVGVVAIALVAATTGGAVVGRVSGTGYDLKQGDSAFAWDAGVRCAVVRTPAAERAVLQNRVAVVCTQMGTPGGLYSSYLVRMTDAGIIVKRGTRVLLSRKN